MENLQACFGDSPTVNELLTPDPRIQGGACRTLAPSPEGGLASPRALRPRRRRPQPSGGLHACATRNPPTRTGHEPSWGGSPPKDGFVETVVAS